MQLLKDEERIAQLATIAGVALLALGCFFVLRPFISALLWAVILTFSSWPIYTRLLDKLGGRKTLSALIMTVILATAFVLPLVLVGSSIADDVQRLVEELRQAFGSGLPGPPHWLGRIPLVGFKLGAYWEELSSGQSEAIDAAQPLLAPLRDIALKIGLFIGGGTLQLALSVLISFFLYRDGAVAAERLRAVVHRIAGDRAHELLEVAAGTIRSVVYGLIGTALVQGTLAAIGFLIAGVPAPLFLGMLCFLLSLLPIGPPLIWGPAAVWLFMDGDLGMAIFLGLWGALVVSSVDNFLKPYLISLGSNVPFLVVFLGVIGGALAFGVLGIFLGPTLLAVGIAMVRSWFVSSPVAPGQIDDARSGE